MMSEDSAFDRCRAKISEYFEKYGMKETLNAFNKECTTVRDETKNGGKKRRKNDMDVIDEELDITDGVFFYYLIHTICFFCFYIFLSLLSMYRALSNNKESVRGKKKTTATQKMPRKYTHAHFDKHMQRKQWQSRYHSTERQNIYHKCILINTRNFTISRCPRWICTEKRFSRFVFQCLCTFTGS